jgi:lysophospholipase L1-like esterase
MTSEGRPAPNRDARWTWRTNLLLLCAALLVAAIGGEVTLRIALPAPVHWRFPQEGYLFDPETGFWLQPNQTAFTIGQVVHTNSRGFRDRDYGPFPPPGTTRVVGLGDSETFGNGIAASGTWPKQLEAQLNASSESPWEVINAGIPGTNTWQHDIMLRRVVDWYHPQVAILGFYVNDVAVRHAPRPAALPHDNTLGKQIAYILKSSALLMVARSGWHALTANPKAILGERAILTGEYAPNVEPGWKQVTGSLRSMKAFADAQGAGLLIVVLPRRDQVSGQLKKTVYNQRLAAIADTLGIPLVDPLVPLQEAFRTYGPRLFVPWDGHDSALANRVIADVIAPKLIDLMRQRGTVSR